MVETITKYAAAGKLRTVVCRDKATNEEVNVLCLVNKDGILRPIAKLFPTTDEAVTEVSPPGNCRVIGQRLH